ncbi:MAG: hypothetical protein M0P77_07215 [Firmicutes bacterium]|nr:hypothetical protein [Bacillota bacterium]
MTISDFNKLVEEQKKYYSALSNIISFDEFDKAIEKNKDLLDFLGDKASDSPIISIANGKTHLLSAEFLISAEKTLQSISACCRLGSFSDANTLIRKYRDCLFLYLYIIEVLNNIGGLTETEYGEVIDGEINEEKFLDIIKILFYIYSSGIRKDEENKAVDGWFDNSAEDGSLFKFLDIKNYLYYLKKNKLVKDCIKKHNLEEKWEKLKRKQNNYVHNNSRCFITDNFISFDRYEKIISLLKNVRTDVTFITSLFLTILILIKPEYISSYDYIYYLEEEMEPPNDSQYWISPIVQTYLDECLISIHLDLKEYLKANNPYNMAIK